MAALVADEADAVRSRSSRGESKSAAQRGAAIKAAVAAVLSVVAVIAVCAAATNENAFSEAISEVLSHAMGQGQPFELKETKDVGSMKTINSLLKKLDTLSSAAQKGEERDKHADVQVKEIDDETSSVNAPSGVKHGIAHVSNALKEAEDAEKSFKSSDSETDDRKAGKKKAMIAAKMKALQQQILSDFSKVTGFGKSAGYIPPVKLPHV